MANFVLKQLREALYTRVCCILKLSPLDHTQAKDAIDIFFSTPSITSVLYSISSFFYAIPSMVILQNVPEFGDVSFKWQLYTIMGFTQSVFSYAGDTYDVRKYRSFVRRGIFNVLDVVHATILSIMVINDFHIICACTDTFAMHMHILILATVMSFGCLFGGIYLSYFKLNKTNIYQFAQLHTLWHTFIPICVAFVFYHNRACIEFD